MNYRDQTETGTSWRRCHEVHIYNQLGGTPSIRMDEQDVFSAGAQQMTTYRNYITTEFDPEKAVPLLDPDTGLPTGEVMTHAEMYRALYSIYMAAAADRDLKEQGNGQ